MSIITKTSCNINQISPTHYFAVIGNRDHIKIKGERRPFWEFLDVLPDGYLSSLAYLPLRDFALPDDKPRIFDCGAWSYKAEDIPKLGKNLVTPDWAYQEYLKYAKKGDRLIAPDHMLLPGVDHDYRREFNKKSAEKFLEIADRSKYNPVATVHGMTLEERLESLRDLIKMGYESIAIGGVAARASQKKKMMPVIEALVNKARVMNPDVSIHVLGLSSPDWFSFLSKTGVNSCDGSSHFKQAFTAGTFFMVEGHKMVKYKAARQKESVTAPLCHCKACSTLRGEGVDTRRYGSNETNMGRAAHNLNMLMIAQKKKTVAKVALISCVAKKKNEASPAGELYASPWFLKCKSFVQDHFKEWGVLSAKHGLLSPNKMTEPYNLSLNDFNSKEKKEWTDNVISQVKKEYTHPVCFEIFAGESYRKYLVPALKALGHEVSIPLKGLGIGQQLAWFDGQKKHKQLELF